MIDLKNVIDPALGVTLNGATGINDEGQIVANSGGLYSFLLTPVTVPEPATLGFFGAALLVLIASVYANRRQPIRRTWLSRRGH